MEIRKIKSDLHIHGFCGWTTGPGQSIMRLVGDSRKRDLRSISDRCFRENQNTLVGMINFNDNRYEGLVNTRKRFPKNYQIYDDHKKVFIGINNSDLWNFVLRGQEIPTEKGHLLIIGGEENIRSKKFKDVLKEAKDVGALRIVDHPLAEYGLVGRIFNKFANNNEGGRYSLGEENLRKFKNEFDAIEVTNSNVSHLINKTGKIASELNLPGIFTSDSHTLNKMFSSYMIFSKLDFTNPESLKESLKEKIKSEDFSYHSGKNRKFENLLHAMAVVYNIVRQKTGIIKEKEEYIV